MRVLDGGWQVGDARFDVAWTCTLLERSGYDAPSSASSDEHGRQGGAPLRALIGLDVPLTP